MACFLPCCIDETQRQAAVETLLQKMRRSGRDSTLYGGSAEVTDDERDLLQDLWSLAQASIFHLYMPLGNRTTDDSEPAALRCRALSGYPGVWLLDDEMEGWGVGYQSFVHRMAGGRMRTRLPTAPTRRAFWCQESTQEGKSA